MVLTTLTVISRVLGARGKTIKLKDQIKKSALIKKIRDKKLLDKKIKEMEEDMIEKMFENKYNMRTHAESFELRDLRNNERLGYTKEPLFTFIPFEKSTIDYFIFI